MISLRTCKRASIALATAAAVVACGGSGVAPENFKLIAHQFVDDVEFIHGTVRTALAEDGKVAFSGIRSTPHGQQAVFVGSGEALAVVTTYVAGYSDVQALQISAAGELAFIAHRNVRTTQYRGLYRTDTLSSQYVTLHEGVAQWNSNADGPTPPKRIRMAANGMLGFGTNINGNGGIYRVPAAGMPELLRAASGTYYNNGALDVNDAGTVCVQMEYMDPNSGLSRGLLVFDTPGDTLATIETTLMNAGVGVQPRVAMNNAGQVAFALNDTVTIHYYTPPLPGGGMPSGTQTLQPGVYLATPVPFGTPFTYTLIASNADGYSDFGEIDLNDQGVVVFEARYAGQTGVFSGSDPITDRIAMTNRLLVVDGEINVFNEVRLGQLNNQNQVSLFTNDTITGRRKVWRVDDIK